MKVYIRAKCKNHQFGALAHYSVIFSGETGEIKKEHISVFLPRLYDYVQRKKRRGINYSWDDIFCHCISHEHIHKLLQHEIDSDTSTQFDNIAGQPPKNPFEVYAGLRL